MQLAHSQTMKTRVSPQSTNNLQSAAVSLKTAAETFEVSKDFLRDQIAAGRLPAYRNGRLIRVLLDDLATLFARVA